MKTLLVFCALIAAVTLANGNPITSDEFSLLNAEYNDYSCDCALKNALKVTCKLLLSEKMELTRENFRTMIYYEFRLGLSRQECIDQLVSTFGDEAPSFSTMKNWYNEFNRGRGLLKNEPHEGRLKSVVVPQNIDAARNMTMEDRHVTYHEHTHDFA
ncbi:uncharacterized protein LOC116343836 [Contarinia nasturtii]|uniref:uncharacterized protein LOC116343836 n=1 Tax=Contarinia nasturtii TaxID=265458 RepID=UPI0012D4854A|nr:uncharacterized protein LOC116343836 [Contarinia nasturtii]